MTIPEFGQTIGLELPEDKKADVAVVFSNGVEMPRRNDGFWWYEHDGKVCINTDPRMAVVGAESIGEGKAIYYGRGLSNEVFNSDWLEYDTDDPRFVKIRSRRNGGR